MLSAKEHLTTLMMLIKITKTMVHSTNEKSNVLKFLQSDTLETYLFIICQDYVLGKSI